MINCTDQFLLSFRAILTRMALTESPRLLRKHKFPIVATTFLIGFFAGNKCHGKFCEITQAHRAVSCVCFDQENLGTWPKLRKPQILAKRAANHDPSMELTYVSYARDRQQSSIVRRRGRYRAETSRDLLGIMLRKMIVAKKALLQSKWCWYRNNEIISTPQFER